MGVSFKISKAGRRFCPKPLPSKTTTTVEEEDEAVDENPKGNNNGQILSTNSAPPPSAHNKLEGNVTGASAEENEVSFTLNLFPDGYYIGRPSENHSSYQAMVQDAPKFLHPYDRTSEALFSAIESGRLPGDMLDDIPCKYFDGMLLCEVRDYRNCSTEAGLAASSPTANKVRLSMSLENVVKDIPLMSDNTWTYGDLMEVESRILKALQPQLCLDPTPKLDRLCTNPVSIKLNLDVRSLRRKRRGEMPEVIVTSSNKINGKKVCIDRVPESPSFRADVGPVSGNLTPQHVHENAPNSIASSNLMLPRATSFVPDSISSLSFVSQPSKYHMGPASNAPGATSGGQDMMLSYAANMNSSGGVSSGHGRRENQDGSLSPLPSYNKRARGTPLGLDGNQQQHMGTQMDSLHGSADSHWKNTLLHQQSLARGFQYANNGMQKFPQQMYEGGLNQEAGAAQYPAVAAQRQGMRYPKEEPVETERLDKSEPYQNRNSIHIVEAERNRLQQRLPPQQHAFMRSNFPQPSWNNFGQPIDNNLVQKRKSAQSPRVSGSGGLPQSPLSSKSGEFSSGSVGPQFGPVITSALGSSHKDKSVINSVAPVGGATSLTSSANDNSMQRQQQVQLAAKRKSNSLPKTSAMSGVGSPASVSNMSVPLLNASSPADDMLSQIDPMMLDRFSKIETVAQRHQITRRKNKVDDKPMRKSVMYPTQQLMEHLSGDPNSENFTDEMGTKELAKSLIGGSMNVCKFRVLTFVQNERVMQGNGFAIVPKARTRMILSAKPSVGTITMHYGDLDYTDFLTAEENLPILPNAHLADLLAAQLSSLMLREGYEVEDNIHLKPTPTNRAPQSNNAGMEMQPYSETIAGQQQQSYGGNEVVKPTNSGNPPLTPNQNTQSARMLPPQNPQSLQISQGFLPGVSGPLRPQQNEPPLSLQQQPAQLQRSPLVLPSNQLPQMSGLGQNSSMLLGNQMVNKPSPLQLQLLQQHQQQQQQPRKMMMGMGNIGNNTGGLGGLGNVMGMGAPRGIGGQAISGPMGPILGGGGQNPMNLSHPSNIGNAISQQFHTGQITRSQAQAIMAVKLRMHQNRNMMGGGGPQSSLGGIAGARQMHPGSSGLSMLGHSLNRAMTPMQRSAMGPMAPPKLMTGMNLYMNQQIPQQQQQQPQPQMQLQQQIQQPSQFQQQQLQQQQDSASPLQSVLSPPQQLNQPSQHQQQQQQQASPQQMSQRTPMSPQQMSQRTPMSPQLSSGAMHCINVGNAEACPASPQLSSQTLGSVSSIANSPMELQGVNKNGSVSNG